MLVAWWNPRCNLAVVAFFFGGGGGHLFLPPEAFEVGSWKGW